MTHEWCPYMWYDYVSTLYKAVTTLSGSGMALAFMSGMLIFVLPRGVRHGWPSYHPWLL